MHWTSTPRSIHPLTNIFYRDWKVLSSVITPYISGNKLYRKRAKHTATAVFPLLSHCENICRNKWFWQKAFPRSKKVLGCFSPQRRGRASGFCPHSLGTELFWFKCRQETHSFTVNFMLFSCSVWLPDNKIYSIYKNLVMFESLLLFCRKLITTYYVDLTVTALLFRPSWRCQLTKGTQKHIESVKRKHVFLDLCSERGRKKTQSSRDGAV